MIATAPSPSRHLRVLRPIVSAIAALLLLAPAVAGADVDLTNAWVFSITGPPALVCDVALVQNVVSLDGTGSCRGVQSSVTLDGAIDPQSGDFTVDGVIMVNSGGVQLVDLILQGGVSGPGALAGSATLDGMPGSFTASLCGNGVIDGDEACDDGVATNGCCTTSCTPKPDGISCSTTSACQIAPTCSAGVCNGAPKPAGTECEADGNRCTDDACDGAGACVAGPCSPCCGGPNCTSQPRLSCKAPTDDKHLIDLLASPGGVKDKLRWTIPHLQATSAAELPDPQTTDYVACFYVLNGVDDFVLSFDAVAPAGLGCGGKRCWTRAKNGTVTYRGGKLRPDGVTSLRVKPGADGKASLTVVGQGAKLDTTDPLQIPGGELLVELHAGDACWGQHYVNLGNRPDIRTSTRYKKRGAQP